MKKGMFEKVFRDSKEKNKKTSEKDFIKNVNNTLNVDLQKKENQSYETFFETFCEGGEW